MSKNKDKKQKDLKESVRGAVGGQAVIEGVMMKSKDSIAIAVRRESGEIVKSLKPYKSIRDKYKILNIPVIRGVVNFIEMMSMSMSTMSESVEMLGLEEQFAKEDKEDKENKDKTEESKTDKESKMERIEKMNTKEIYEEARKDVLSSKTKKSGTSSMTLIASIIGIVFGLALSFFLFFFLPTKISSLIKYITDFETGWSKSIIEGITRMAIFVIYILLVSLMKDIKRTFQYHGAEHMSVFCHEAGDELTVGNAKKYSRFHPRCGTSFLIVMMIIGVVISIFIPDFTKEAYGAFKQWTADLIRIGVKLALFPFIIGIGFEFIKYAGKHDNIIIKILSAPGLWIQRLTTKKPDDQQLEVAVTSLRAALKIDPVEEPESPLPDVELEPESPLPPFEKGADGVPPDTHE